MPRDYLTDFELMLLLAVLRVGEEAYGVPIAREIEASYLLGDDEPLVGDLVEEWPRRSNAWFWCQVVFAILSFQVVVAGSLLDDLIRQIDRTQMTRIDHPEWLLFSSSCRFP